MGQKKLISITFSVWRLRVASRSYTTAGKGQDAAAGCCYLREHP